MCSTRGGSQGMYIMFESAMQVMLRSHQMIAKKSKKLGAAFIASNGQSGANLFKTNLV